MITHARVLFALSFVAFAVLATDVYADNTLTMGDANGQPGAVSVPVFLAASHDVAIQGYSAAGTFPVPQFSLVDIDFTGTILELILGGSPPEYAEMIIDNVTGEFIVGVIFDINPTGNVSIPATPDPANANLILRMLFDVNSNASPGDFTFDLVDGLGDPPVNNVFSSDGQSIFPQLFSGTFTIPNLFTFRARDVNAAPGSTADVIFDCSNETAIEAFTVSFIYPNALLTRIDYADNPPVEGPFECLDLAFALAPESVEFVFPSENFNVIPGFHHYALGVIFDFVDPLANQVLPVGTNQSIMKASFSISPSAQVGSSVVIDLTNDYPTAAPVANLVVLPPNSQGVTPTLIDGSIFVVSGVLFLRGDHNGDNQVGLADGIGLLQYLFNPPQPFPSCFDASDITDDGSLDITDPIFLITYLFLSGCTPPAPFPSCGIDAVDTDTLDCMSYPNC